MFRSKQRRDLCRIRDLRGIQSDARIVYDQHNTGNHADGVTVYSQNDELSAILNDIDAASPDISTSGGGLGAAIVIDGRRSSVNRFAAIHTNAETVSHVLEYIDAKEISLIGPNVTLRHVNCGMLNITARSGHIKIEDCFIGNLNISFPEREVELLVDLSRSRFVGFWIGNTPKIRDFRLDGTSFARYTIKNALLQELGLSDSDTPRINRESFALLYACAQSTGNSHTAHIARGEELAQERRISRGLDRFFLTSWGALSDFGLAPFRPLLYLLLVSFFVAVVLFVTGTEVGLSDAEIVGWRTSVVDKTGWFDDAMRAIIGSVEGLFSPLSSLSGRNLIVPNYFSISILKTVHGYFAIFAVFLTGFALRRRFRIFT